MVSLSARRIPGDADRDRTVLLAFEDVTARADITADLLANSERKDQFIAMLGHELRHPLTPITHAIYLLRRGNPDPAAAELSRRSIQQTQRLLRFVNELLDVARIGRGLIEIRRERLDFVALVVEAVRRAPAVHRGATAHAVAGAPGGPDIRRWRFGPVESGRHQSGGECREYTEPGGQITVTLEQHEMKPCCACATAASASPPKIWSGFSSRSRDHAIRSRTPAADWDWDSASCGEYWNCIVVTSRPPAAVSANGKRVRRLLPVWAAPADDPGPRARGNAGSARTRRVAEGAIVDDHEEIAEVDRAARPHVGSRGRHRQGRPERASRWRKPSSRNAPSSTSPCRG